MAEESKKSGLVNDGSLQNSSMSSVSLDESLSNLEEYLDFDIYNEDIPLIAEEANSDSPESLTDSISSNVVHFTDPSSTSPNPIPLNLSSFNESKTEDYSSLDSKPFSEDDLDDILLKDDSAQFDEDGPIALSSDELDNITGDNEDYSTDYEDSLESEYNSNRGNSQLTSDDLDDKYDTDFSDDENITLGSDELDQILNPDEDEDEDSENEFEAKSFFDTEDEEEEDGPIALSSDELDNITNSEYSAGDDFETEDFISEQPSDLFEEASEEEIALSGDELNNLLESGNIDEEDYEEGEPKSFFDDEDSEEDEQIALSADELSNITDSDYSEEDGIETEDLSSGIESNEYGVSTESVFGEDSELEEESISLSGDELENILGSGEIETEDQLEDEMDSENAKSFFDSEEDESISLSPDELGNITAEEDYSDNTSEDSEEEDNFDLSDSTEDLELGSPSNLFEDDSMEEDEIALSGDELNNLLESGEIETEEESSGSSFFEEGSEEDESIALSPDELGNITAEEDYEVETIDNSEISSEEDNFDLSQASEDFDMESSPSLFGEDSSEDTEIALSGDELSNLLESGELETEDAAFENPIDSGMVIGGDDFVIDENSSLSNLGDFDLEDSTPSNIKDYSDTIESFKFGSVKKEELRKVISYMDELLGSLPDSYIKEFASSEYFELYKKIMNELEL